MCMAARLTIPNTNPKAGKPSGLATANQPRRAINQPNGQSLSKPESFILASASVPLPNALPKSTPVSPIVKLIPTCKSPIPNMKNVNDSGFRTMGNMSTEMKRFSTSVANNSIQIHGANTAVPAIDGEERLTAKPPNTANINNNVTSRRSPCSPSPAGIKTVARSAMTKAPDHRT